ncbi:hypothetical protein KY289_015527 [Solanum tuberosum]|nr:hypothetical protein KY289_015527 [Solanum tuberosum]
MKGCCYLRICTETSCGLLAKIKSWAFITSFDTCECSPPRPRFNVLVVKVVYLYRKNPFDQQSQPVSPVSLLAIEEECSVPVVHQETPSVSFIAKESNVAAAKEEECSVRPDYDIATYHKELDVYAAFVLESMVPYIPEGPEPQEDEDQIPLFCEDFYIGHTNLWS